MGTSSLRKVPKVNCPARQNLPEGGNPGGLAFGEKDPPGRPIPRRRLNEMSSPRQGKPRGRLVPHPLVFACCRNNNPREVNGRTPAKSQGWFPGKSPLIALGPGKQFQGKLVFLVPAGIPPICPGRRSFGPWAGIPNIRLDAGIRHILDAARDQGHCYLTRGQILEQVCKLLEIDVEQRIDARLLHMEQEGLLRTRNLPQADIAEGAETCYYAPSLYYDEDFLAQPDPLLTTGHDRD